MLCILPNDTCRVEMQQPKKCKNWNGFVIVELKMKKKSERRRRKFWKKTEK